LKGHAAGILCIDYSPDGRRIVTASADRTARIWDAETGAERVLLKGHREAVYTARFSSDGLRVVTASRDDDVCVWNASSGLLETTFRKRKTNDQDGEEEDDYDPGIFNTQWAIFGPDDNSVLMAWRNKILSWKFGEKSEHVRFECGSTVNCGCCSADGTRVFSGDWEGRVLVFDRASGSPISSTQAHPTRHVHSIQMARDGSRIITAGCDYSVRVWNAKTMKELAVIQHPEHTVRTVSLSRDGHRIAAASPDGRVWIWERRRPESAYGILILPEFWLVVVLAVCFVWSVHRDRRELG
jgi:WD40 repeat protein